MVSDWCPEGWKIVKLGDLGEVNRGRSRHRPRYAEYLYGGSYPFIQTGDIKVSRGRITTYQQTYSEAGLAQSRLWPAGTMCITIAANIAETGILTFPACFPDSVVGFIADDLKCNVYFVEYMFRFLKRHIQHEATGSVQDNINLATLNRLRFPLPPLSEQKAIAHILGTLDDKIELNRQMNQTLEAMARAIFKSWFVDFDPVRAKMEGRQPAGMDAATAELFPNEFEESALGMIPKGWNTVPFEELFLIPLRNGLTRPKAVRGQGTYMVNMGELFAYRRIGDIKMDRVPLTESEAEKNLLHTGDLLFARQSLTLEGAGQSSIVIEAREPRTFESHLIRCRLNPDKAVSWYYFYYFQSNEGRGKIWSLVEQVAAAGIRGSDLAKLNVLAPAIKIQRCFGAVVEPLEKKMASNDSESRTLASIRDTLLPKLLSGEIRVKEAEKVVETVI